MLPTLGLVFLAIVVVLEDDGLRTSSESNWPFTRIVMWVGFAAACLYVARRRRPHSAALVDGDRALRVALPVMLVIAVVATPVTAGSSLWNTTLLLLGVLSVILNLGISAAIGILVTLTVKGLEATRDRGKRVSAFIGERKRMLLAIVGAKLLGILLVWALRRTLVPDEPVLDLSLATCVMATIAAAIVVVLLVIDSHVRLSRSDHEVVSRFSGIVVGGALSCGFAAALLIGVGTSAIATRPLSLIGAALLLALAVALSGVRRWPARVTAYAILVVAGAVVAVTWAARPTSALPMFDGGDESMARLVTTGGVVALLAVVVALIWIVVASIMSRRFGWITYVATVVVWVVIQFIWSAVAPFDLMTFDLALTLFLGVAAMLLVTGAQDVVDGFEIVVVAVTTFLLIEVPMVTELLPEWVQLVLLSIAVLGPGLAVIWKALAAMGEPATQRGAVARIALTTAVYFQLSVGVWLGRVDIAKAVDLVTDFAQYTLVIPLLLLMVAAHNPARASRRGGVSRRVSKVG